MSASTTSCTACGAQNQTQNQFCTVCGVTLKNSEVSNNSASEVISVETSSSDVSSEILKPIFELTKRNVLIALVLTLVVSFILGVRLTSENVLSGVIGNRYTEKRLKNEKAQSYEFGFSAGSDEGYSTGFSAGKDEGYSTGFSAGEIEGCNSVFDKIGNDLIAIRFPWYDTDVYGYRYSQSDFCK